jgi:serine/threonine protein kinase
LSRRETRQNITGSCRRESQTRRFARIPPAPQNEWNVQENLASEISILTNLAAHKNIVQLFKVDKGDKYIYLYLEYCHGGDLSNHIRNKGPFPEAEARQYLQDIADGLAMLRRHGIIHRDLKPQNILLSTEGPPHEPRVTLKIADFGFAKDMQQQTLADTLCGSPLYMAPEVLERARYGAEADLWSVGAIIFEVLTKKPPFTGTNYIVLLENIRKTRPAFPPGVRPSDSCTDLIKRLLTVKPDARISFDDFFSHPFVDRKDAHVVHAAPPELLLTPTAALPGTGTAVSAAAAEPVGGTTTPNAGEFVGGAHMRQSAQNPAVRDVASVQPLVNRTSVPLPLPMPLPFAKSEPSPPAVSSRMDLARASLPLAFESEGPVERRWSDVPPTSMSGSQRATPWGHGPLPIPNPITPLGGSAATSMRNKEAPGTVSSAAGADFVMVDTEFVRQRRASSPLIPPSAFNPQWRQRQADLPIAAIVSAEEAATLRRIEPLVLCAQHVVELADDKLSLNQVPVAIALYTKVLEQVHSELCGLQVHTSEGAGRMRQTLACLFDSAMRKAEAARSALRGRAATAEPISPSRAIFDAALEYGRSGAGYDFILL